MVGRKQKGWYREPVRHGLASKGVETDAKGEFDVDDVHVTGKTDIWAEDLLEDIAKEFGYQSVTVKTRVERGKVKLLLLLEDGYPRIDNDMGKLTDEELERLESTLELEFNIDIDNVTHNGEGYIVLVVS